MKEINEKRKVVGINMTDCKDCQGRGVRKTPHCDTCKGKSYTNKKIEETIQIPECIENGSIIKFKGRGHQEKHKGFFGDLVVKFIA